MADFNSPIQYLKEDSRDRTSIGSLEYDENSDTIIPSFAAGLEDFEPIPSPTTTSTSLYSQLTHNMEKIAEEEDINFLHDTREFTSLVPEETDNKPEDDEESGAKPKKKKHLFPKLSSHKSK
uniref:Structural protein p14.5 n=1 Tax=African swine fever virus (isolate Tick/South Africa/Pretoriuskop Pr4/1996) TaxID=561443 RepID=P14_ASFP4|nr:RecName: Full=Structural protein p14.5 [African swine fever virus tick/South Africa/Pretoriuskop Pr4/1996]